MNLRLRELREAQHISVASMIERLGVKDSRYRKWESQSAAIPLEFAMRCCSILHCSMDELSGFEQIELSNDEREVVGIMRALGSHEYKAFMNIARGLKAASSASSPSEQ